MTDCLKSDKFNGKIVISLQLNFKFCQITKSFILNEALIKVLKMSFLITVYVIRSATIFCSNF